MIDAFLQLCIFPKFIFNVYIYHLAFMRHCFQNLWVQIESLKYFANVWKKFSSDALLLIEIADIQSLQKYNVHVFMIWAWSCPNEKWDLCILNEYLLKYPDVEMVSLLKVCTILKNIPWTLNITLKLDIALEKTDSGNVD